jgi:hypothetical protein
VLQTPLGIAAQRVHDTLVRLTPDGEVHVVGDRKLLGEVWSKRHLKKN